jgi:hypothetical protein
MRPHLLFHALELGKKRDLCFFFRRRRRCRSHPGFCGFVETIELSVFSPRLEV